MKELAINFWWVFVILVCIYLIYVIIFAFIENIVSKHNTNKLEDLFIQYFQEELKKEIKKTQKKEENKK